MAVEISYYDVRLDFFVPVEEVGMVQVVVCTGSVQRHRKLHSN